MKGNLKMYNYNKIVYESQDLVRNVDGLTTSDAFEEIIKLLFTKNYCVGDVLLTPDNMKDIFQTKVYNEYKLFNSDTIKLSNYTILELLELFKDVDFTSSDVKGRLFESYLGRVFTSGLGQFFTPRTVVNFISDYIDKINNNNNDIKVLDPACGSGGLLLTIGKKLKNNLDYYGYDINERLVRVSSMNLLLNGIDNYTIKEQSFLDADEAEFYDLILTNPPFGVKEKRKDVLDKFKFGKKKKQLDLEVLFIEKIIQVLKPGGLCGIVLPDGILNNSSRLDIRNYLLSKTNILSCIDLPSNVFKACGTGCESGILFFQKKQPNINKNKNCKLFKVDYIGFETQTKFAKPINKNDLINIINDTHHNFIELTQDDLKYRFDPKFHIQKKYNKNSKLNYLSKYFSVKKNIFKIGSSSNSNMIKYIQYSDINTTFGIIKGYEIYDESDLPSRAKYIINTGDVLVPLLKQSINKIAIVTPEYDGCVCSNGFAVLKPRDNYSTEFLFTLFKEKDIKEQLMNFSSGTIMPSFDVKYFPELKIRNIFKNEMNIRTDKIRKSFGYLDEAKKLIDDVLS